MNNTIGRLPLITIKYLAQKARIVLMTRVINIGLVNALSHGYFRKVATKLVELVKDI